MFTQVDPRSHTSVPDEAFARIHAALAPATPEQTRAGIGAVAAAMRAFVPNDAFLKLGRSLRGEIREAILAASSVTPVQASSAEAETSLVMQVAGILPRGFPTHACAVVRAVLAEIAHQTGPKEAQAIIGEMPDRLRKLWPLPVWRLKEVAHAA